jgi:hypothetical protein
VPRVCLHLSVKPCIHGEVTYPTQFDPEDGGSM